MPQSTQFQSRKTALLVIDIQRALFTRPDPIYNSYKFIETINAIIERSQLYGVKVVYVKHTNQTSLKEGTEGWQFHPDISPQETDLLIQKKKGNAFLDTPLHSELNSRGIKYLLITGLVTEGCIQATCLGGIELGYSVILVEDGHSNYNKDAVDVILKSHMKLEQAGVEIISSRDIGFVED